MADAETAQRRDALMAELRDLRDRAPYYIYDSVVIRRGAANVDRGWFNTFNAAANTEWKFFVGRSSNVPASYTNITDSRRDWAFTAYRIGVRVTGPSTSRAYALDPATQTLQMRWVRDLPHMMSLKLEIAQADTLLQLPIDRLPAGGGTTGTSGDDLGLGLYDPGTNGVPHISNMLVLPEPIEIPAQGQISVTARIDQPLANFLGAYSNSPGQSQYPGGLDAAGDPLPPVLDDDEFKATIFIWGARDLQLRAARSAR